MVGYNRWYETKAFYAMKEGPYIEADIYKGVSFDAPGEISGERALDLPADVDNRANDMHERVVDEITAKMLNGLL